MVGIFEKGTKKALSTYFFSTDFDCKCTNAECTKTLIDLDLIPALEEYWKLTSGFIIDSGYRCEAHNKEVGGKPDSQHLLGTAADCKSVKTYNGHLMAKYAEQVPLFKKGGIGIYPTFCHVDIRKGTARWAEPTKC